MKPWLCGRSGGLFVFVLIAALVAGGLGWASHNALRLERDQQRQAAASERADRLRLALWRLDRPMTDVLALEAARPFSHYSAVHAPPLALDGTGQPLPPGTVLQLSPLLWAELPDWMLLHFQTDESGWESPQVLSLTLHDRLCGTAPNLSNVTKERKELLEELCRSLPPEQLLTRVRRHAGRTTTLDRVVLARMGQDQTDEPYAQAQVSQGQREWAHRRGSTSKIVPQQRSEERIAKNVAILNFWRNGEEWLDDLPPEMDAKTPRMTEKTPLPPMPRIPSSAGVNVRMSGMVGLWLTTESGRHCLIVVRLVRIEEKEVCQGIVLDGDRLASLLAEQVSDLFPSAKLVPVNDPTPDLLDRSMAALPLRLDPGPEEVPQAPTWTALRAGLYLAWAAALVAIVAVGFGGWSLLSLSERRVRFVSAVTHELRTPLTTLRLYLDMLLGGMVRDEKTKQEYLETMHAETDRLTRLVGNVLDFSRLESQQPKLTRTVSGVAELLTKAGEVWNNRCNCVGKELIVEDVSGEDCVETDADLLQQVLANLLDNACKYSREAADRRVWLRARREGDRVVFEVEDRGPGVPAGERATIFRPFRRGKSADATTGGVGLGLALARWWSELLGGRLSLHSPSEGGACFRVALPVCAAKQ